MNCLQHRERLTQQETKTLLATARHIISFCPKLFYSFVQDVLIDYCDEAICGSFRKTAGVTVHTISVEIILQTLTGDLKPRQRSFIFSFI